MKPTAHDSPAYDCTAIQAQLPLYVGGDLESPVTDAPVTDSARAEALAEPIRIHVAGCASCASELARLQAALSAIGALRTERLPGIDVWSGVRAGLVENELISAGSSAGNLAAVHAGGTLRALVTPSFTPGRRVVASWAVASWRRVAASIALVGLGIALWNLARDRGTSPLAVDESLAIDIGTDDVASSPTLSSTRVVPTGLEPTLVADSAYAGSTDTGPVGPSGLHKVGAGETELWRQAQRFGTPTISRPVRGGWQAASYPVYDPRVR